mgnify:CR=1 FL=1
MANEITQQEIVEVTDALITEANISINTYPLWTNSVTQQETDWLNKGYEINVRNIVSNFMLDYTLTSLKAASPPIVPIEASQSEMQRAYDDWRWNAPQYRITLMKSVDNGANWRQIAIIPLIQRGDKPYVSIDLMPYISPGNSRAFNSKTLLGFKGITAGNGLIKSTDVLTISATVSKIITVTNMGDPKRLIGEIIMIQGKTSTPPGFLRCDGQTVSKMIYRDLWLQNQFVQGVDAGGDSFYIQNMNQHWENVYGWSFAYDYFVYTGVY